jgi:thiol-disulfide isomerase/thioredoxin
MYYILFCLLITSSNDVSADQSKLILQASLDAIITAESIQYDHERLVKTDGNVSVIKSKNYFENNEDDAQLGMKFLIKDNEEAFIYNGSEFFLLNEKEKTIRIHRKPSKNSIENYYLFNSLLTLKKNLPLIIADESIEKTLKDTMISNKVYDLVTIRMFKKIMESLGGFFAISEDRWIEYRLVLDKQTHHPVELHQQNFTPKGEFDQYILISFQNMVINKKLDDQQLYYSSYLKSYREISSKSVSLTPLAAGSPQVNFSLPRFPDDAIQSHSPSDQPTVLYFWISNCGYCIEAVPKLNQWMTQYQPKNIDIIGINAHDAKQVIDHFVRKYNPAYPTLYQGADLAKQYGINGFPSVVILQKGKILYNGGVDEEKIKMILERN